ncbi:hypothetical protein TRVL_07302 [Trypanosoma vivax]|nr:hypothetical protein TRVL_07302 [Trypanosoma vivax]
MAIPLLLSALARMPSHTACHLLLLTLSTHKCCGSVMLAKVLKILRWSFPLSVGPFVFKTNDPALAEVAVSLLPVLDSSSLFLCPFMVHPSQSKPVVNSPTHRASQRKVVPFSFFRCCSRASRTCRILSLVAPFQGCAPCPVPLRHCISLGHTLPTPAVLSPISPRLRSIPVLLPPRAGRYFSAGRPVQVVKVPLPGDSRGVLSPVLIANAVAHASPFRCSLPTVLFPMVCTLPPLSMSSVVKVSNICPSRASPIPLLTSVYYYLSVPGVVVSVPNWLDALASFLSFTLGPFLSTPHAVLSGQSPRCFLSQAHRYPCSQCFSSSSLCILRPKTLFIAWVSFPSKLLCSTNDAFKQSVARSRFARLQFPCLASHANIRRCPGRR